jgi:uncharacterized iron-regulated membrane protein
METNPYEPPKTPARLGSPKSWEKRLHAIVMQVAIFVALLAGYFGLRLLFYLFNQWLFPKLYGS